MSGPLTGTRVLDLTRFGAGPACTMLLADLGAETVKVESPGGGDPARGNAPAIGDIGGYFPQFNRNKASITLNLRDPRGKKILLQLVEWADLVVENFRVGTLERLGLGYEQLSSRNPGVVLVSVSGFGQGGPYAARAAFDPIVQAMGGMMYATGREVGVPVPAGGAIGDLTGGLLGAFGALAALRERDATGIGQHVDVSMLDGQLYQLGVGMLSEWRTRHAAGPDAPPAPAWSEAEDGVGPFTFRLRDGVWMAMHYMDDGHWPKIAEIVGRPELASHVDFVSRAARAANRPAVRAVIKEWAASVTWTEAEPMLTAARLAFGRVATYDDLVADEHIAARGTIQHVPHVTGETLPLIGPMPRFSRTPGAIRSPAPALGQDNEHIYRGLLGIDADAYSTLVDEGVI